MIVETDDYNLYNDSLVYKPNFNRDINIISFVITRLTFGNKFNHKVYLPCFLTHLTFGKYFNQPINLTNMISHLTFGDMFNQPINLVNSLIFKCWLLF